MTIVEFEARSRQLAGGTWFVRIAGELDLHTAPELERSLPPAASDGAREVIVDLSDCTFIDSTALGILLELRRRLARVHGALKIIAPPGVRRPFEMTGLDRLFDFCPAGTAESNGGGQ